MVSKEEENFLRIVYLYYSVATGTLTRFFDKLHPHLYTDLNIPQNKAILQPLHYPLPGRKRVLYQEQWNILYPPPGAPPVTSAELDLTLIVCLLRNLPPVVVAPVNGFDELPFPRERSNGAHIARLKYYKNFFVSHSADGTLSNGHFVSIWNTLEQAITGLDNSQATAASLMEAKTKMLDNSMAQMLSTQIQLETKVSSLQDEIEQTKEHVEERMKMAGSNLERHITDNNENMHILYERLNTKEEQMVIRDDNIVKDLQIFRNWQQLFASKFNKMEIVTNESKKEKEELETDMKLSCSQIQFKVSKHKEKIESLETKSENLGKTLHEVKKDVDSIKATTECIESELIKQDEDHIPNNIRAHHGQEIKEWEEDQTFFVETRATRYILEALLNNNCIVVTGSSGCGKSSNIHHAALYLRNTFEYEIVPVLTGPTDIINYYYEKKRQVFLVDDICGKETINTQTLQIWRDYLEKIEKIFKIAEQKNDGTILKVSSPKLLISCRLHIYKESQFQRISLFKENEYNLLSDKLCLLEDERVLMIRKYIQVDNIQNVIHMEQDVDFFPLLCKLSKNKTSEEVINLFKSPVDIITNNITHIVLENKFQFCALVLCILFEDGFNTDWLKLKLAPNDMKEKLKHIVEEFEIDLKKEMSRRALKSGFTTLDGTYIKQTDGFNTDWLKLKLAPSCKKEKPKHIVKEFEVDLKKNMSRRALKSGFTTLDGTYIKQTSKVYKMIHDKINEMAAVICGKNLTECFIKYAPSIFIRDHFLFETIIEIQNVQATEDLIIISEDTEEEYFRRLLNDLNHHVVSSTFHNAQLIYQSFIDKLLAYLTGSVKAKQILKNLDEVDYRRYTTPLIESASSGFLDLVQFLITTIQVGVNITDVEGKSPLYKASEEGHSEVVNLLLDNNANISLCNNDHYSPLYIACKRGHIDTVEILLKKNADVSQCNNYRKSPLYIACNAGHTDIVKMLLQYKADVSQCDNYNKSPLYVACEGGQTDTVQLLLLNKADTSQCNRYGESPLFVACKEGHTETVQLLLQNNADVSKCNEFGESPLHAACEDGRAHIAKLLLQNNANVSRCNEFGTSPLYTACDGGYTDTVKLLIQYNADICQCNNNRKSPLYVACEGGHTDTVKYIIKSIGYIYQCNNEEIDPFDLALARGHVNIADFSMCINSGKSPLPVTCKKGYTEIMEVLLQNHVDVSRCDDIGVSPLYAACEGGYIDIVQQLLQNNADVSQCNSYKQSPLFVACERGYTDIVQQLLQNNADVSQCNSDKQSPLCVACERGYTDIVRLLLENNADVSQCNSYKQSPLFVACKGGYTDIVKQLLQNNADVSQCNSYEQSPLCVACDRRYTDIVRLLLQNNADVPQCNSYKQSALFVACERGYTDIVKLLLQNKADVFQCNSKGESPLYVACTRRHVEIVRLLLQNNADVSQCNCYKQSPLFVACERGYTDIVKQLLQNNADVSQCNFYYQSPLYVACKRGHTDIVKLLLQHKVDVSTCNSNGKSPLYAACARRHVEIVRLLLKNKADVSQCEQKYGLSPLHIACDTYSYIAHNISISSPFMRMVLFNVTYSDEEIFSNCIETVKLLLAWNADVKLCNKKGQTPLDIACKSPCMTILNLLLKATQ